MRCALGPVCLLLVTATLSSAEDQPAPNQGGKGPPHTIPVFAAARTAVAEGRVEKTRAIGFSIIRTPFSELSSRGAVLVGFDLGLRPSWGKNEFIAGLRPVYQSAEGILVGRERGSMTLDPGPAGKPPATNRVSRIVRLRARDGYAVGAVTLRAGLRIDAMSLTYMRLVGEKLDPAQSYVSDLVGNPQGGNEKTIGGSGAPLVGVFGNTETTHILALGLIQMVQPAPPPPPRRAKPVQPPPVAVLEPVAPRAPEAAPAPPPRRLPEHPIIHRDRQRGFLFELPPGWRPMPADTLGEINRILRAGGARQALQYDEGYCLDVVDPGAPYVLVHVEPVRADIPQEQIERVLGLQLRKPLRPVEGAFADLVRNLPAGSAVFDRERNRVLSRRHAVSRRLGRMESFAVCHLGTGHLVSLHCYARERDFPGHLPAFIALNNSLVFQDADVPAGPTTPAAEPTTRTGWLLGGVFLLITFAVSLPVVFLLARPRPVRISKPLSVVRPPADEEPLGREPTGIPDPFVASEGAISTAPRPARSWESFCAEALGRTERRDEGTDVPYFTVRAGSRSRALFRIYVLADELLFLDASGGISANYAACGWADREKLRAAELNAATLDDLCRMVEEDERSFRLVPDDLSAASLEALSFWGTLFAPGQGWLRIVHAQRGEFWFALVTIEDMQKAIDLLPGVLGDRLVIRAVLDRKNWRFTPLC